ncbi:MAG TPA: hypothetical protein VMU37_08585 [Caulobacteraceae bacterium]|nr:hypothetical protein [Caulobacteraceae bacterium]
MVALALAAAAAVGILSPGPAPTDAALTRQFQNHRADFEIVREMAQTDRYVTRIAPTFVMLRGASPPPPEQVRGAISDARLERYRDLFRRIGDRDGIDNGEGYVFFAVYDAGLAGSSGVSKGIAWSADQPPNIVKSLDGRIVGPLQGWRQIAPNWYIELDYD